MRLVGIVECGRDLLKLRNDLVMPCHVRGQDASDNALSYFPETVRIR